MLSTPAISGVSANIFKSRARRLYPEELPAILVYTKSETAEIWIAGPRTYKRTMKLAIEVVAKADDNLDDTLDTICEEIETRFFRNETLGGLVSDCVLSDTEIDFVPEVETPVGAARITFDCEYFSGAPDEQPNLEDFETAHIETLPEGSTEDTEPAVDDVEMPQD